LAGCKLGEAVYLDAQVMMFHGARIADGCWLGAGSIVHRGAHLRARFRVGISHFAIAQPGGRPALITSDLQSAREALGTADFFSRVFDIQEDRQQDSLSLHAPPAVIAETRYFSDRQLDS
jgi:carbonic anhydrase/acetyltransferase-like protein (isoleucine patch superfamily)